MNKSLLFQYLFKVCAQLVGLIVNVLVVLIVPKTIGASSYGVYGFITDFFSRIYGFLDLGLSNAFFTRLSQFRKERFLIPCFFHTVSLTHVIVFIFVLIALCTNSSALLWPEVGINFIFWGLGFVVISWTLERFTKVIDALGYTTISEIVRIVSNIVKVFLIMIFYFQNRLNLETFFFCSIVGFFILLVFQYILLKRHGIIFLSWIPFKTLCFYIRYFYRYASPLVISLLVTSLVLIIERWVLQSVNGSVEQSYFTLANQLAIPCIMFTSSFTQLFHREVAVLVGKKQYNEIGQSVLKFGPFFFFMSLSLSLCAIFNVDKIIALVGKDEFEHASIALLIMLCYPIHQSYGQLVGALYLATSKTRLYKNLTIFCTLVSFVLSMFLLLPKHLGGLELGAVGLSLSMIIAQFISVHLLIFCIRKILEIPFLLLAINEVLQIVVCICVCHVVTFLVPVTIGVIWQLIYFGLIYFLLVMLIIVFLLKLKIPFFFFIPEKFKSYL